MVNESSWAHTYSNFVFYSDMAHIRMSGLLDHDNLIRRQAQTSLLIARESADRFTQLARVLIRTFSVVCFLLNIGTCAGY
jgi:hypothetical protein